MNSYLIFKEVTKLMEIFEEHKKNFQIIIKAITQNKQTVGLKHNYLTLNGVKNYQQFIYEKFERIIKIPPFGCVSKTDQGWLIVEDHRDEMAAEISLISERYGIGVAMLVLHAQQMNAGHILLEMGLNENSQSVVQLTERLHGLRGEHVLYIPIRKFRKDTEKLAELNIIKPEKLWDRSKLIEHPKDPDKSYCFYCSAREMNPAEIIVNIEGRRLGLSRNYSLGYTFAPFGNPLSVVHFLAWDYHPQNNPLDMSLTPVTVSDLVKMTEQINVTIMNFFAGTIIKDYPIIDGISNGWTGSIYHQHFQFFQPEYVSPITQKNFIPKKPILERDDILIHKLDWPTPVYKVTADDSINVGLVGNYMAGTWRLQNKVNPTQNIYVTGCDLGKTIYILPRDKKQLGYLPSETDYVNKRKGRRAKPKAHMGVLEATGTMIVDEYETFKEMETWEPSDISRQIELMTSAIRPNENAMEQLEKSIEYLFG